jgi:hypothetical protein
VPPGEFLPDGRGNARFWGVELNTAGLRSLTAPALVSWAAHLGWLDLSAAWSEDSGGASDEYVLNHIELLPKG